MFLSKKENVLAENPKESTAMDEGKRWDYTEAITVLILCVTLPASENQLITAPKCDDF